MDKCKYTDTDIIKYVIYKMNKEDENKFQFHLSQCNNCKKRVERFRILKDEFIEMFKS